MKSLTLLLQAAVTLALLTVIGYFVDFRAVMVTAATANPVLLGLSCFVLVLQPVISALRWLLIVKRMNGTLRPRLAIMASFLGAFLNQLLPGAISGDAVRLWVAYRHGNPMRLASTSVIIDRMVMLAVLLLLGSASASWSLDTEHPSLRMGLAGGVAVIATIFVCLLWLERIVISLHRFRFARAVSYLAEDTRRVMFSLKAGAIMALCIASYLNLIVAIYLIAKAVEIQVGFLPLAMMLPVVLLASALPASLGGWGAREAAMIIGMGWLHVDANSALTVSVLFGLASLLAASPGLFFYTALKPPKSGLTSVDAADLPGATIVSSGQR